MPDLFAIARANAARIAAAFDCMKGSLDSARAASVQEFANWVEDHALISINVRLLVIVELLDGRPYQNVYEWAEEQAVLCGRPFQDIVRERLGSFYECRAAFDSTFESGRRFRYGALNAGGVGLAEHFAPYSLVLTEAFHSGLDEVCYLPGDSLAICFRGGVFDLSPVERAATPHSVRHLMVATERASETPHTDKDEWSRLVLSEDRYFEAIFIGDIRLDTVYHIRVPKAEHDRLWGLAFSNFGRKLSDAERALVHDFVQLRRAVVAGRVRMEVIT